MNRLQKKCLIAATGTHFLLVVVLLCSGFIQPKPKPDDSQVLDVIPAKLIDAAMQSGVRNAQPPPPTPPTPPEPPQPPTPTPPKPEVAQVEPPKPVEHVKPPEPTEPTVTKPEEPAPTKPKPHEIKVDLTPVIHKNTTKPDKSEAEAKAAERAAAHAQAVKIKAMQSALNTIKESTASATTVELPGNSSEAYANYASIVKSVYTERWILPDNAADDEANVKVSVTIARDGRVIDAHIVERSGDSSVDASVQKTLDRVQDIAPFPDDSTDKERTYIINFNLKAKRMLG